VRRIMDREEESPHIPRRPHEDAVAHAPRTREEFVAAVHEMANRGMSDYSISRATELSVEAVRRFLAERST
jgi:hypothetical protein